MLSLPDTVGRNVQTGDRQHSQRYAGNRIGRPNCPQEKRGAYATCHATPPFGEHLSDELLEHSHLVFSGEALRLLDFCACVLFDELQANPMNYVMRLAVAHARPPLWAALVRAQRDKRVRLYRLRRVDRDSARRHVHASAGPCDGDGAPVCRHDGTGDRRPLEFSTIAKKLVERLRIAREDARVIAPGRRLSARFHISSITSPSFPGACPIPDCIPEEKTRQVVRG